MALDNDENQTNFVTYLVKSLALYVIKLHGEYDFQSSHSKDKNVDRLQFVSRRFQNLLIHSQLWQVDSFAFAIFHNAMS